MSKVIVATFTDKAAATQVFEGLRKADCVRASDYNTIWFTDGVVIELEESELLKVMYLLRSDARPRCPGDTR